MSILDSPSRGTVGGGAIVFNLAAAHQIAKHGHSDVHGSSKAERSELAVIVKRDQEGCPTAVYNEFVAARLGELMGVPVAPGVLSEVDGEAVYVSLAPSGLFERTPHVDARLARAVAMKYPWEAAGLFVFDVLIGNWDRLGNVKASAGSVDQWFIIGFDHANSLLMATSPGYFLSTEALRDLCPVVDQHMFAPYLSTSMLEEWLARIERIPTELFGKRCFVGQALNRVDVTTQGVLACALESRLKYLYELCYAVLNRPVSATL